MKRVLFPIGSNGITSSSEDLAYYHVKDRLKEFCFGTVKTILGKTGFEPGNKALYKYDQPEVYLCRIWRLLFGGCTVSGDDGRRIFRKIGLDETMMEHRKM